MPFPPTATIRAQVAVPLRFADGYQVPARVISFRGLVDGLEHVAIGLGRYAQPPAPGPVAAPPPLVRPHSECLTGDVFGSQRCDCGPQLREAVQRITDAGGYLLYLRQEGLDTYEANLALGHGVDERTYTVAAQMLLALGMTRVALLSNNPDKLAQLRGLGITVTEQLPTRVHLSDANADYLATKARRGHHTLLLPPEGRRGERRGPGEETEWHARGRALRSCPDRCGCCGSGQSC
jgi:GTP cyclohydrolase II